MRIDILTLFPEMFEGPLSTSIIGRARQQGYLDMRFWNIRDFSQSKHKVVDDTPYGGGAGMVMRADVVVAAIEHVTAQSQAPVVYVTPQGKPFTQSMAKDLAMLPSLILLCGHYEGLDERVIAGWVDEEVSIGDYVLTGGEIPAMVISDAVCRLIPGVLGDEESFRSDSFYDGLLEHPHYTRPAVFRGLTVPDVLVTGHHENIRKWRLRESLRRTYTRRPELLEHRELSKEEQKILIEVIDELDERG